MTALGNKEIMSKNIKHYMEVNGVTRKDMCEALGVKYTTLTDWINGNSYPRIDKIELMANYFGIAKADLVEDHTSKRTYYLDPEVAEMAQKLYDDPDKRALFDASNKLSKEDMQYVVNLMNRLEKKND